MADEVLALLGCQLLAFAEGIDVDKVIDVLAPAGENNISLFSQEWKLLSSQWCGSNIMGAV